MLDFIIEKRKKKRIYLEKKERARTFRLFREKGERVSRILITYTKIGDSKAN